MITIPFMDVPYFDCPPLTDAIVADAEHTLGYKLPQSYLQALQVRNGGILHPNRITNRSDGAPATSLLGLPLLMGLGSKDGIDSLFEGVSRNSFLINEWKYPNVGVVICHYAHVAFMLDYSVCSSQNEPQVIFANREWSSSPNEFVIVSRTFSDLISRLEVTQDKNV